MKQSEFKALVEATVRDTSAILVAKGEEYAGSTDRLANFKRGASLTGATPLQVAFIYASKHYDSIATYVKKDAAGFEQKLSEPIEGRFDDLINYCMLMKAIVHENNTIPQDLNAKLQDVKPQPDPQPNLGDIYNLPSFPQSPARK
jgi:hypothetical protein